jgi:hypothetical protein
MQLVNLNVQIWKKFTHDFVPQIPTESKKTTTNSHMILFLKFQLRAGNATGAYLSAK